MTASNDTPDPDRGDEDSFDSETSTPPQIIVRDSDEEDFDDNSDHGYQMLQQNEDQNDDNDEHQMTREEEIAALVRAAQTDPENLSDATRDLIDQSR